VGEGFTCEMERIHRHGRVICFRFHREGLSGFIFVVGVDQLNRFSPSGRNVDCFQLVLDRPFRVSPPPLFNRQLERIVSQYSPRDLCLTPRQGEAIA